MIHVRSCKCYFEHRTFFSIIVRITHIQDSLRGGLKEHRKLSWTRLKIDLETETYAGCAFSASHLTTSWITASQRNVTNQSQMLRIYQSGVKRPQINAPPSTPQHSLCCFSSFSSPLVPDVRVESSSFSHVSLSAAGQQGERDGLSSGPVPLWKHQ